MRLLFISIVLAVLLGLTGYFFFIQKSTGPSTPEIQLPSLKRVDFSIFNPVFRFSGHIPSEFEVEYIPQLKALSIYDLRLSGKSIREKSQIYITSFEANRFLTLSTVEITQQDQTLINGHDAVLYEITKKAGVPDFTQQPNWRNSTHKALDMRLEKNNPSVFYSFAYNPELSQALFDQFINSLEFHDKLLNKNVTKPCLVSSIKELALHVLKGYNTIVVQGRIDIP